MVDQPSERETILIVPIDDIKSINKQFVLQQSGLLKNYFYDPGSQENSLFNSNRFLRNAGKHATSNRSILQRGTHYLPDFRIFENADLEEMAPLTNPFISTSKCEVAQLRDVEVRERRKTSGLILNQMMYQRMDRWVGSR